MKYKIELKIPLPGNKIPGHNYGGDVVATVF
jgi:hypothetical protein